VYKVLKKDGTIQDFDWKKVTNGLLAAGVSAEEAEKVAQNVEMWLSTYIEDNLIKSYDLHLKVIEILKEINPDIAARFENFKKPIPQ